MGESDWWMCGHCRSLNNLSARKCYSCHRGKPKDSARASDFLGYQPVITRDGKVRLEFPAPPKEPGPQQVGIAAQVPPLRDPIPRSITDVAPRVPHGTRIVYRLHEPLMPGPMRPPFAPRPAMPAPSNRLPGPPPAAWHPAPPPRSGMPAMGPAVPPPPASGPFPGPRPVMGMPVGRPPMVGVPIGHVLPPGSPGAPWPGQAAFSIAVSSESGQAPAE
jgi:hypothetical protein